MKRTQNQYPQWWRKQTVKRCSRRSLHSFAAVTEKAWSPWSFSKSRMRTNGGVADPDGWRSIVKVSSPQGHGPKVIPPSTSKPPATLIHQSTQKNLNGIQRRWRKRRRSQLQVNRKREIKRTQQDRAKELQDQRTEIWENQQPRKPRTEDNFLKEIREPNGPTWKRTKN